METLNIIIRIFSVGVIAWGIYLAITSKEFHETLRWLIKGEE